MEEVEIRTQMCGGNYIIIKLGMYKTILVEKDENIFINLSNLYFVPRKSLNTFLVTAK